ncbi:RNA-directed DNA polymerase from mobile element jockey, partial [Paramuricea clavata]
KLKNSNPERWWKEVKAIGGLSSKKSWYSQLFSDDVRNCEDLAKNFNNFLTALTSHFDPLTLDEIQEGLEVPNHYLVDAQQIYRKLSKIKTTKSPGPDMFPKKILKTFAFELAPVMSDIFNSSMTQGTFPKALKRSIVVPVPKVSPPKSIEDDLRPISLTSQIAKVMEDCTLDNFFPEVVNKLDTKQFAPPKKSTTHALVYLLHSILVALERGSCTARLFFADFKKGFDLVDHNVIIKELTLLGTHPSIIRWIKAFLCDREQCVRLGTSMSSWKKTNGGLPQGTKLGPLLFAVLINSLLKNWPSRIKFVDDTSALEIIPHFSSSLMPLVVNEISDYALERGMELNYKKCKQMLINFLKYKGSDDENPIYVAGVWISNDLSWNTHVDMVLKKANSRLYALRLLKKAGLQASDIVQIYISFIRSRIEYASPVWSSIPKSLSDILESVQKRALRIAYPDLLYDEALEISNLQYLSTCRDISCKKFVESLRRDVSPYNPLTQIMEIRPGVKTHDYDLRNDRTAEQPSWTYFVGSVCLFCRYEAMSDLVALFSTLIDEKGNILVPGVNDSVRELTSEEEALYANLDFDMATYQAELGAHGLTTEDNKNTLMRRWRYPSLSIHGFEGAFSGPGDKTVIPKEVTGKFSIRLVPDQDPAKIGELVIAHLKKVHRERGSPNVLTPRHSEGFARPWLGDFENVVFEAGKRATNDVHGVDPDYTREGGSIPVVLTLSETTGKDCVLLPMGRSDDGAHSQNEKLNISNFQNGMKLFAAYLKELAISTRGGK